MSTRKDYCRGVVRQAGRRGWIAALFALTVTLTACGSSSSSGGDEVTEIPKATSEDVLAPMPLDDKVEIKIALNGRIEAWAPALLAEQLGEFEKENIDVEFVFISMAESSLLAAQGEVDVAGGTFNAGTFNLIGGGAPLRFVYPGDERPADSTQGIWMNKEMVNPAGGELTAEMFVGKEILTVSGDGSPSAAEFYAWVAGLPGGDQVEAGDLEFTVMDPSMTAQALENGAAPVALVISPFNLGLSESTCCEFLEDAFQKPTNGGYLFGRSLERRADVGAAIVRAMTRTTRTYLPTGYRDMPETMKALSAVLDLDVETLKGLPPLEWDAEFGTRIEKNLEKQSFFRDRGLLQYDQDVTAKDVYDTRYLTAVGASGD